MPVRAAGTVKVALGLPSFNRSRRRGQHGIRLGAGSLQIAYSDGSIFGGDGWPQALLSSWREALTGHPPRTRVFLVRISIFKLFTRPHKWGRIPDTSGS